MLHAIKKFKTENTRDVLNFVSIRQALPKDDAVIGDFLVSVFAEKQKEKLQDHVDSEERSWDLRNVKERRQEGVVMVFELGHQIVATFALIHPQSRINESWLLNSSLLRCVALDKDFRGLNVSKLLLDEVNLLSRKFNSDHVCLHVFSDAPRVAFMYENNGFNRDTRGDSVACGRTTLGYSRNVLGPQTSYQGLLPIQ
jgi:hypothetical protein